MKQSPSKIKFLLRKTDYPHIVPSRFPSLPCLPPTIASNIGFSFLYISFLTVLNMLIIVCCGRNLPKVILHTEISNEFQSRRTD